MRGNDIRVLDLIENMEILICTWGLIKCFLILLFLECLSLPVHSEQNQAP